MLASWVVGRTRRVFYGWWIVASGMISAGLTAGTFFQGFQFFFEPMRQQFGWSRTAISGAYSLSRVESGFLGPIGGWLVQKYGPRAIMVAGVLIFGAGFILMSQTRSIVMFYIAFLILSIGSSLASWNPVGVAINNWFRRKRSRAIGMMMFGMGLGGLIVAPLVALSIGAFGWQATAMGCGVVAVIVLLPLSRVLRSDPEPHGYLPDGDPPLEPSQQGARAASPDREYDFTVKEALRSRAFWLLSLGHSVALLALAALSLHLVPFLESELGFSKASAAQVVIVMTAAMMVGQPVGGYLGDRFPKQYLSAIAMLGHGLGIFLVATAGAMPQVLAGVLIHGVCWGVRGPILTAMRGDFFGRRNFAVINGFTQMVMMVGQTIGPILAGFMADHYSYELGFQIIAAITASGFLLFLFLKSPQPDMKRKLQQETRGGSPAA
jgi:MFS family permease